MHYKGYGDTYFRHGLELVAQGKDLSLQLGIPSIRYILGPLQSIEAMREAVNGALRQNNRKEAFDDAYLTGV